MDFRQKARARLATTLPRVPHGRKQYGFNGLAGCVEQRKARENGRLVGIYHNEQAGFDDEMPWSTVCEEHGQIIAHKTLKLARWHASNPTGWCEHCTPAIPDDGARVLRDPETRRTGLRKD